MKHARNASYREAGGSVPKEMKHQELTAKIIECAYNVYNTLGYGFLESVYQNALLIELLKAGLRAEKEQKIQVHYDNQLVGEYVADIIVEQRVQQ